MTAKKKQSPGPALIRSLRRLRDRLAARIGRAPCGCPMDRDGYPWHNAGCPAVEKFAAACKSVGGGERLLEKRGI